MDITRRLITLREQCGFTQNGLAERAGVSQTHLRRVELGQADITIGHLQLLCDAMGITIQEFFSETTNADEVSIAISKLTPKQKITQKDGNLVGKMASEGTTPRRLTDLIGSLCDLTSGSGDKGTPIVWIQGYFDNYTAD